MFDVALNLSGIADIKQFSFISFVTRKRNNNGARTAFIQRHRGEHCITLGL